MSVWTDTSVEHPVALSMCLSCRPRVLDPTSSCLNEGSFDQSQMLIDTRPWLWLWMCTCLSVGMLVQLEKLK